MGTTAATAPWLLAIPLALTACGSTAAPAPTAVPARPAAQDGAGSRSSSAADAEGDATPPPGGERAEQTSSPAPEEAPPRRRVPESGCIDPSSPRIATLREEAKERATASFERELRRLGLSRATLPVRSHHVQDGTGGVGPRARSYESGTLVETTVEGVHGRFIAGWTQWSGAARPRPTWELARDESGAFVRLVQAPQPSARSVDVWVCACARRECGPYGSGCPACGSTSQAMYGPLPDGASYRGEVVVAYEAPDVTIRYAKTDCPPPRRCPPPPPSAAPRR